MEKEAQRRVMGRARRLALWSWVPDKSFYDQQSPEDRLVMIGSCIDAKGQAWLKDHPRQVEWLAEQGRSPQDALRRYKAWQAERESLCEGEKVVPIGKKKRRKKT